MAQSKKQTTVEPVENKAQVFYNGYLKLCKKEGYQLVPTLAWQLRDDGTWSTIIQTTVAELPKKKDLS